MSPTELERIFDVLSRREAEAIKLERLQLEATQNLAMYARVMGMRDDLVLAASDLGVTRIRIHTSSNIALTTINRIIRNARENDSSGE